MTATLLVNGTDLTRYDRTIMLADWGSFLSEKQYRGDDVVLPGMVGEVYGGRVAAARTVTITLELTGNSGANIWPATTALAETEFLTNLATLKTLVAVTSTPLTLTLQPAGTTVTAVLAGLEVSVQNETWADVALSFKLLGGTL